MSEFNEYMSSFVDRLRESPFFASLPEESLTFLAARATQTHFPAGAMIFGEGEPSPGLYWLHNGFGAPSVSDISRRRPSLFLLSFYHVPVVSPRQTDSGRNIGRMEITKETKVSAILQEYGDIADVMEMFGIKRVGGYSLRRMLTKVISVENAARIHRVPLGEFMMTLEKAVGSQEQGQDAAG